MSEIESVKASKAGKRHRLFDKVVSGSGSGLPSAFLLEDSQKLAKRAILSVRRGPIRYHRNSSIVCEGDPADYVFMVVDGIVRRCKTFQNGARAIVAFHTPGELFGWTDELKHALSIEAATDALVLFFKRSALISVAARIDEMSDLDLPMSHQDIADHLGLSIETVSRTITELEQASLIERVSARTIVLKNRAALARLLN